jgi:hypothetical protein
MTIDGPNLKGRLTATTRFRASFSSQNTVEAIAAGDFNRDGHVDFAIVSEVDTLLTHRAFFDPYPTDATCGIFARQHGRSGETVYAADSKSAARKGLRVQVSSPALAESLGVAWRGKKKEKPVYARNVTTFVFESLVVSGLTALTACVSTGRDGPSGTGGTGGTGSGASGEIPIVAAAGADVPYQFGANSFGVTGGVFLARANLGSSTVVLDTTQVGKICLEGTVEMVPTPADGSHPPYSTYWGIELGFNLNQGADAVKTPWMVPAGVLGFWFTVEGPAIPPIRFKTTPTGRDPALEQDSCALVSPVSGDSTEILFTNMYVQCWDGPLGTGTTNISRGLLDMGFQVAAATGVEYPIDFCVTHVGVVTN